MKKSLGLIAASVVLLLLALVVRTFALRSVQPPPAAAAALAFDSTAAAEHLAAAIRYKTVSHQDPADNDATEFSRLHDYLAATYPRAHSELARETVAGSSLLYTWRGRRDDLEPIALLAHLDVVPVSSSSASAWEHAPFAGDIAGGFVWGRGAMDDKASLIGIMEAVEALLAEGFAPERSVYLAFGHDEEVAGRHGAAAIAATLAGRGAHLGYVLDEGLAVTENLVPGVNAPVAMIGIAEKGYVSVKLTVAGEGGHSSMPPARTAVGVLAAAIDRLQRRQMAVALDGPAAKMFAALGPEMPFAPRLVFANLWLFSHMVLHRLTEGPSSNAMVRTTTAPTMLAGSEKENVLPTEASAVVNFRIHPRDSVEAVLAHVRRVVGDEAVKVSVVGEAVEPSAVSSVDSAAYHGLAEAVHAVFPEALVAPSMVLGGTDARHYSAVAADSYRFLPYYLRPEDLPRLHGSNERLSVEQFAGAVRFYAQLLRNTAGR